MTKEEFLSELKHALGNDLSGSVVNDNVAYYEQYITEEIGSGRSEEEVITDLGDPWAIARNIINGITHHTGIEEANRRGRDYSDDYEDANYRSATGGSYDDYGEKTPGTMGKLKAIFSRIAVYLIIALVIITIFAVVGVAIRFAFPLIIIYAVIVLVRNFTMRR